MQLMGEARDLAKIDIGGTRKVSDACCQRSNGAAEAIRG
jgi:hypothetical protein